MGDYPYPVVVLGNWTSDAKLKQKLQIYFQSQKKSGGGECKVEFDKDSNSATVWFKSADDRETVLKKKNHDITIDNKEINLRVLKGDQCTSSSGGELAIEQEKNASQLLMTCTENKRFQHCGHSARPVEQTESMRVKDLPSDCTEKLMELSFQTDESGGGPMEAIKNITDEQAATMTFTDPKNTVQHKKQHVGRTTDKPGGNLPIPFTETIHRCLWLFLDAKKSTEKIQDYMKNHAFCQVDFKTPEITFLPVFLSQNDYTSKDIGDWKKNVKEVFSKMLSEYDTFQCSVNLSVWKKAEKDIKCKVKDDVFVEYDQEKTAVTVAGLAKDIARIKPVVERILQTVTRQHEREVQCVSDEMRVEPTAFSILQQDGIEQCATRKFPELKLAYNSDAKKLVFSGLPNEVLDLRKEVEKKLLEIKQKHVYVDFTLLSFLTEADSEKMSFEMFTSCDINALYKIENESVLIFASCDQTLNKAEGQMKEVLTTLSITVQDKEVLRKPEWLNLKRDLMQAYNSPSKMVTISHVTETMIGIFGLSKQVRAAYEKVSDFINKNTYIEEFVPVKCNAALKFIQVSEFKAWEKYASSSAIKIFFDSQGPCIKLCGGSLLVEEVKTLFHKLTSSLFTDCLKICRPGAGKYFVQKQNLLPQYLLKQYNCVVMLQEDMPEAGMKNDENTTAAPEGNDVQWTCKIMTPSGKNIIVGKGDLCQVATDAVVNAANGYLKHTGGLAGALSFAAGPQLQQDSDQYVMKNGPLQPGDATVTQAGRLPCQIVIHAVGPRYRDTDSGSAVRLLERAVMESLTAAMKHNSSSIAIPAISSGIFGFPLNLCAETIAKAVRQYCENHPGSGGTLKKIYLLNHDDKTVQAMTGAVKNVFGDMQMWLPEKWSEQKGSKSLKEENPAKGKGFLGSGAISAAEKTRTTQGAASTQAEVAETPQESSVFFSSISTSDLGVHVMQIGRITFTVSSQGITKEVTDNIVSFGFSIDSGSLPATLSRNQPYNNSIHVGIQNNVTDISKKVSAVLLNCEENKFKSISFLVPSAGVGGFSLSFIADAMMDAVAAFQVQREGQHLRSVKVFPLQSNTMEEFYKRMQAREGTTLGKPSWLSSTFSAFTGYISSVFDGLLGMRGGATEHERGIKEGPSRTYGAETHKGLTWGQGKVTNENEPGTWKFEPPSVYKSVGQNFTPTVFWFCAHSAAGVAQAKDSLHKIIKMEQTEKEIEDGCIAKFSGKDFAKLSDLERKLTVKIHLEKQPKPLVHLEGLTQDVLTAEKEITDIINGIILAQK